MKMSKKQYIMVKAYLNNNLGDDLFLHILASRYPQQLFYIYNQCRGKNAFPENIVNRLTLGDKVIKAFDGLIWRIGKCFGIQINRSKTIAGVYMVNKEKIITKNSKECILITGSGFIESEERRKEYYLKREAEFFSNNPIVLGCNFGPFITEEYYQSYRKMFRKAKDICFRDNYSQALFSDLENTRCEKDIIFGYTLGEKKLLEEQQDRKYMLISVVNPYKDDEAKKLSDDKYNLFMQKCIKNGLERGLEIVLIGFCRNQKDDIIIEQILNDMDNVEKIHVYNYPDISYKEAMGLFKYATEVIASRYHAMVIAMLYQKKVYPIAYNEKMIHVLQDIDKTAKIASVQDLRNIEIQDFFKNYGFYISEEALNDIKKSANRQFLYLDDIINGSEV